MTRYQGHPNNVGLDQLRRELVTPDGVRPVEDVTPGLASKEELDRVLPMPKPKIRHRSRERRAQLRRDEAGAACACDDTTPCLAHHAITGRRRFLRPSDRRPR